MKNYYNSLSQEEQLTQLGKCDFLEASSFSGGVEKLKNKKVVIVGCGAQGLNQGLNMRFWSRCFLRIAIGSNRK